MEVMEWKANLVNERRERDKLLVKLKSGDLIDPIDSNIKKQYYLRGNTDGEYFDKGSLDHKVYESSAANFNENYIIR